MHYMSADLVNRMNDEAEDQEKVAAAWEAGCEEYEKWLQKNESSLPAGVQKFLDLTCLHDATPDPWCRTAGVFRAGEEFKIITRLDFGPKEPSEEDAQKSMVVSITYLLEAEPHCERHHGPGFPKDGEDWAFLWLYDEFDIDDQGRFIHHILFSDGTEMHVTFSKFSWFRATVEEEY
jgi:hypothetical protein